MMCVICWCTRVGMAMGRDGDEFHYLILILENKIHIIPIPKPNGYQSFIPSSSLPNNGYNLVLIHVPVSLLLQYKF